MGVSTKQDCVCVEKFTRARQHWPRPAPTSFEFLRLLLFAVEDNEHPVRMGTHSSCVSLVRVYLLPASAMCCHMFFLTPFFVVSLPARHADFHYSKRTSRDRATAAEEEL